MKRIGDLFENMQAESSVMVPGSEAADLLTTYGVPPELVQTLAAEQNFTFDWTGFAEAMEKHAGVSDGGQRVLFQTGPLETLKEALRETPFVGYESTTCEAVVKGIITGDGKDRGDEGQLLSHLDRPGDAVLRLVLDRSPFYGESGGQVGDTGVIRNANFTFEVLDTQRHASLIVHHGKLVEGKIAEGDTCTAEVDTANRTALARAHSATHVLHHALHTHVGRHAEQQGSKVEPDRLRFDFTNPKAIPDETLAEIEKDVLKLVEGKLPIRWDTVSLEDARQAGAMMLFGEKYPDPCRMVSMGEFSRELCGGTHLTNTAEIGAFEVVVEESVSTGTRRIQALTGERAKLHREQTERLLGQVAAKLGCDAKYAAAATEALIEEVRALKKELTAGKVVDHPAEFRFDPSKQAVKTPPTDTTDYNAVRAAVRGLTRRLNVAIDDVIDRLESLLADRSRLVSELKEMTSGGTLSADDLIDSGATVGNTLLVVAETPGANPNVMRGWIDQIRKKSKGPTAVLLASTQGDKVVLVGGLSRELVDRGLSAGDWVGETAKVVGGGGGGRPDMAQAGGKDPEKLPQAIEQARSSMATQLGL